VGGYYCNTLIDANTIRPSVLCKKGGEVLPKERSPPNEKNALIFRKKQFDLKNVTIQQHTFAH